MTRLTASLPTLAVLCVAFSSLLAQAQERKAPLAEAYLTSGRLAEGEAALKEHLRVNPDDDQTRFGLAFVQMVRAIERLAQSLYEHGPREPDDFLPFLRGMVPKNPDPKPISYEQLREILANFQRDVLACEATLSEIGNTDVKLPMHFVHFRLDLNADGKASDEETLWALYVNLRPRLKTIGKERVNELLIVFDEADVHWMRANCHLLAAVCDIALAYDFRELFERTGHVLFEKVETPFPFLATARIAPEAADGFDPSERIDLITMIHLINFPLAERERVPNALEHLEAVVGEWRQMWESVERETDDDHEWIANPRQRFQFPGSRANEQSLARWLKFLGEAKSLLAGERLIPFWRTDDARTGINLRKIFTEPQRFDLVVWVQGTAAEPYLEKGDAIRPEALKRLIPEVGDWLILFGFGVN